MSKSTSKSKRFEIFKRDGFKCQYCGRTPPEVILHVDHVVPKSKGGGNDDENLLTACQDCNLGKGARLMERVQAPVNLSTEERDERLEQLKQFSEHKLKEIEFENAEMSRILEHWATLDDQDMSGDTYMCDCRVEKAVRQFIKKLPAHEIIESINLTFTRGAYDKFRYFCSVCWHKIKKDIPKPEGDGQCT